MFAATSFWRDLVAFTWNITTVEDPAGRRRPPRARPSSAPTRRGFAAAEPPDEADGVTTAWFTFETAVGRGRGLLRLVDEDGEAGRGRSSPRCTSSRATRSRAARRRPMGAEHGAHRDRETWLERREHEARSSGTATQPYVLVDRRRPGRHRARRPAAPARRADAGRSTSTPRPGDQWRGRYKSLCLHDPVWYDHLPYLKFPDNWPVFAPKDKIGDWLESYVTDHGGAVLGQHRGHQRVVRRGDAASGPSRWSGTASR